MAQSDRQGTGRHPHKSTEEPYPHTRENHGEASRRSGSTQGSEHSRSSEPSTHGSSHGGESDRSSHSSQERGSSEGGNLKQREYRDEKGEVHHHTRTYMEQHKGSDRK
jgi:hypothetical protein